VVCQFYFLVIWVAQGEKARALLPIVGLGSAEEKLPNFEGWKQANFQLVLAYQFLLDKHQTMW